MLYAPNGEPVEIVSGPYQSITDPVPGEYPYVELRLLNDPAAETAQLRVARLNADGGPAEIAAAVARARPHPWLARYAPPPQ